MSGPKWRARSSGWVLILAVIPTRATEFLLRKVCFVTLPSSVGLRFTDPPSLSRQGGRGTRCESARVVLAAPIGA